MNIPLCKLIAMPIVRPIFKINVLKMEQAFQMGYRQGEKVFFISPTIWQGEKIVVSTIESLWGPLQKEKNNRFEELLQGDLDFKPMFGKMFHVWDRDHIFQTWFSYIEKVHPLNVDWHICMDNFFLNSKSGLVDLITSMTKLNK